MMTMTSTQPNTLVIKDQAGDYYLLPLEALEQGRIPAERRGEVDRLVEEADTAGFFLGPFSLGTLYLRFEKAKWEFAADVVRKVADAVDD